MASAARIETDPASPLATLLGLSPTADHRLLNVPTLNSAIGVNFDTTRQPILSAAPPWMRFWIVPQSPGTASAGDRLAVIDLSTTRFPALQLLDLEVERTGVRLRLCLPAGHSDDPPRPE